MYIYPFIFLNSCIYVYIYKQMMRYVHFRFLAFIFINRKQSLESKNLEKQTSEK